MVDDNIIKVENSDKQALGDTNEDYSKKVLAAAITMQEPNTKEFIKLYKAPHEEVWEILYLQSSIPQLQQGINLLKEVQRSIINELIENKDERLVRKIKV